MLGVDRGLVDEHQASGLTAHPGLPVVDPDPAPLGDVSACAFRRHRLFFLYVNPARHKSFDSDAQAATTPRSACNRAASSGMVMSGSASTVPIR